MLEGLPQPRRRARALPGGVALAEHQPVARVCVDLVPAHLDRVFEYLVPATLADTAVPGARVKVRFGAQGDVNGYVLERVDEAEHDGALVPVRKVVSAEPVLTPQVARLARAVADRWAGTLNDVLRLAIPARHARVEAEVPATAAEPPRSVAVGHRVGAVPRWRRVPAAPDRRRSTAGRLVRAARRGGGAVARRDRAGRRGVRAGWPRRARRRARRPGHRPRPRRRSRTSGIPRWTPGSAGGAVRLAADDGPPRATGRSWPRCAGRRRWSSGRGRRRSPRCRTSGSPSSGTTATRCTPSRARPTRTCARCWRCARSSRAARCSWRRTVAASRRRRSSSPAGRGRSRRTARRRARGPPACSRSRPSSSPARVRPRPRGCPRPRGRRSRDRLADGPVLVQVPRAGYVPVVACGRCRSAALCGVCHGPLGLTSAGGVPTCGWCGRLATDWRCTECGAGALRSVRVGSERTAEELGRAFPGVPVRVSGARAAGGRAGDGPGRAGRRRLDARAPSRWPRAATRRPSCSTPR